MLLGLDMILIRLPTFKVLATRNAIRARLDLQK